MPNCRASLGCASSPACRYSNRHSAHHALPRAPRFPPSRLVQHLPSARATRTVGDSAWQMSNKPKRARPLVDAPRTAGLVHIAVIQGPRHLDGRLAWTGATFGRLRRQGGAFRIDAAHDREGHEQPKPRDPDAHRDGGGRVARGQAVSPACKDRGTREVQLRRFASWAGFGRTARMTGI